MAVSAAKTGDQPMVLLHSICFLCAVVCLVKKNQKENLSYLLLF